MLQTVFRITHITGEVSFAFGGEYRERVQTQLEALFPLLLPVALVHFLKEKRRNVNFLAFI